MYRIKIPLPHGEIKIPWPAGICFEEVPGAVVELAKEAGETAAKVEQVQEEQQEQAEQLESLENRQRWNDQALDAAFERIWTLESLVMDLRGRIEILEAGQADDTDGDAGEGGQKETVIETPPGTEEKPEEKPKEKKSWGLW